MKNQNEIIFLRRDVKIGEMTTGGEHSVAVLTEQRTEMR